MSEFIATLFLLGVILLFVVLPIALVVFWVWMLVDCLSNRGITDTMKVVWVVLMIFFPFLGSLLYMLIDRPKRKFIMFYTPYPPSHPMSLPPYGAPVPPPTYGAPAPPPGASTHWGPPNPWP
ncbi:phospholipase D-like protein [Thermosporothrix hazakensis]|jgi:hypothetical protein|uniref:Phospholipase D-like protein n=1 Tax=Thermosporothrix hazakensis TaxID=644383 RepID=A0A326U6L0_THEHA|nr:PLD nuclease N-terminal domain-containing protein [Thermosporothrix hazakensis]PZW29500.1 phospholipase D-like protein [Thermosporothrix hazakensis]GCE45785.1 hypothetical protein KTH_06540 [Thermosporothrix hazakensis]